MNMDWWHRYVQDVLAEPDPDIFDEGVMRPDPPAEDPHGDDRAELSAWRFRVAVAALVVMSVTSLGVFALIWRM